MRNRRAAASAARFFAHAAARQLSIWHFGLGPALWYSSANDEAER